MADLNEICEEIVGNVDSAVGAAVVDLSTGLLLAVHHTIPYFTQSYLDAVAASAVDMFRGKAVTNVEEMLSQQRGTEVKDTIQEVQMGTSNTYHFMSLVPGKPNALAILITTKKANLGMGWAALRNALPGMASGCP